MKYNIIVSTNFRSFWNTTKCTVLKKTDIVHSIIFKTEFYKQHRKEFMKLCFYMHIHNSLVFYIVNLMNNALAILIANLSANDLSKAQLLYPEVTKIAPKNICVSNSLSLFSNQPIHDK